MKNPTTTFDFVLSWMKKAQENCKKQGRNDASQLWKDAIEHLTFLSSENTRLTALLSEMKKKEPENL